MPPPPLSFLSSNMSVRLVTRLLVAPDLQQRYRMEFVMAALAPPGTPFLPEKEGVDRELAALSRRVRMVWETSGCDNGTKETLWQLMLNGVRGAGGHDRCMSGPCPCGDLSPAPPPRPPRPLTAWVRENHTAAVRWHSCGLPSGSIRCSTDCGGFAPGHASHLRRCMAPLQRRGLFTQGSGPWSALLPYMQWKRAGPTFMPCLWIDRRMSIPYCVRCEPATGPPKGSGISSKTLPSLQRGSQQNGRIYLLPTPFYA